MGFDNLTEQELIVFTNAQNEHKKDFDARNAEIASDMAAEIKAENEDNSEFDEEAAKQQIFEYLQDHPDVIYPYIVRGAKLYCRMGTHIRKLNLPRCHGVYTGEGVHPVIHAEDASTETQNGEKANIMYFGHCNGTINKSDFAEKIDLEMVSYGEDLEPEPTGTVKRAYKCIPKIIGDMWTMTHHETRIVKNDMDMTDGNAADSVTGASYLVCAYGGLIEPLTCGQENEDITPLAE